MKYRIWASALHSPVQVSYALSELGVSHTLNSGGRKMRVTKAKVQPYAVHVTTVLRDYRANTVNFIVSSGAELATTNYPRLKDKLDIVEAVREALLSEKSVVPTVKVVSPMDYVHQVAKPSLLNKIQTQIYKIQPYGLRKQTQQLVLAYMASKITKAQIKKALSDNLKHEALLPLILSADSLRDAVARLPAETAEAVAADTGHPTFELLYLSKERK